MPPATVPKGEGFLTHTKCQNINSAQYTQKESTAFCPKVCKKDTSVLLGSYISLPSLECTHRHKVNCPSSREKERTTHFKGSGDSFVPERLMCIRARELLKNCLKDGGTSFPFLKNKTQSHPGGRPCFPGPNFQTAKLARCWFTHCDKTHESATPSAETER